MTSLVDQIIAEHGLLRLNPVCDGWQCKCGLRLDESLDDYPIDTPFARHIAEVTEQAVREQATVPLRVELARYEKLLDWALDDLSRGEISGGRNATAWAIKIVTGAA